MATPMVEPMPAVEGTVTGIAAANVSELRDWLRLTLCDGLGPATVRRLLAEFGLPEQVLGQSGATLGGLIGAERARALLTTDERRERLIDACLAWSAAAPDRHLLTLADAAYPPRLLTLTDPPPLIFVRGDPARLLRPSLAVVGSRHASRGGHQHAHDFAQSLAQAGWTVVSGLAAGIDASAHRGALSTGAAGGGTVAVIGNGIDSIYPENHAALAAEIVAEGGAIVAELAPGAPPLPANFPRRNRLIAALSVGVLVVEAARRSGSLITARLAAETGREVFAIPGSIDAPLAKGCHALIKQGAKLVETVDDILSELEATARASAAALAPVRPPQASDPSVTPVSQPDLASATSAADGTAILTALGWDPLGPEALAGRSGLPAARLAAGLLVLEWAGRVERLTDGRYRRLG